MSTRALRLFELQQLDQEIEAKNGALAQVESQLGETEELLAGRESVQTEKTRRQQLEKDQRFAEWEAEDLWSKIAPLDEKLYSGRVKSPKELSGLQHEVDGLKARRRQAEDRQLDIMTQLEDGQPVLKSMEERLAAVEAAWRSDQERLLGEKRQLEAEISDLQGKKDSLTKQIPQTDLHLYAELRETKRGRAVAKVERGMCQGCRISLPMNEIQRVRSSAAPSRCSSCGRILIVG